MWLFCAMRFFLDIRYNGSSFHGWQVQQNAHSVQAEIEQCLGTLLGTPTPVTGSGRTDSGVHALQQIAHIDLHKEIDPEKLRYQMNALLPSSISVNGIRAVQPEAHARFDAVRRTYHYHIHSQKDPFKKGFSFYYRPALDTRAIGEACRILIGHRDFESFSKVKTEVNNFLCDIMEARWECTDGDTVFVITANRFLRGMVRAIVGTLLNVGLGKLSPRDFDYLIQQRDRANAGASVPADGLYLTAVHYPENIYLT
ncbi:MAG: tRNA pseudouridine(38-40) synthase TruA [Cyclobacteriaceae bacterium]|nr:tRNA pseudouridine(38-40) synthase TruA [Cyclobacteriaceae bacterium]